jgi:5-methylcytosine-specific restriction endonuclease McrA
VSDNTSTTPKVKRCSQGEKCIHPKGPDLPRTREYFYFNGNTASARCRECQKAYRREHHEQNKNHDNARSRAYAKENPERFRHYQNHYYARKRENGGTYTHADLDTQYKAQKGCCWWCGKFVGLTFDIDHRVPVSKGGSSDISNIVIACRECNDSKKDKMPGDWNGRLL